MTTPPHRSTDRPVLLITNPSADVYGSDLQMLESISAMIERNWKVIVTSPDDGPLLEMIEERGAVVERVRYPVLRRENASPVGLLRLMTAVLASMPSILRTIRRLDPDVLYVNTVTLPWWLLAGRLTRRPTVCHVHEAEQGDSRLVRTALTAPLLLAQRLIVISRPSMDALTETFARLGRSATLIYNGVPEPDAEPELAAPDGGPRRIAVIGRLSPRKGTDVALETVALLRGRGRDVVLEVGGTAFAGYEWYVEQLHVRARRPDLAGAVTFSGYVSPVWPTLAAAEVVLAPSLREPFGNAVVEAQLAARPVVAAAAMGHLETVKDGDTGLLVQPGDPAAAAAAVEQLLDDPELAQRLAVNARIDARARFSLERYRRQIADVVSELSTAARR